MIVESMVKNEYRDLIQLRRIMSAPASCASLIVFCQLEGSAPPMRFGIKIFSGYSFLSFLIFGTHFSNG